MGKFKTYRIHEIEKKVVARFEELSLEDLDKGEVVIRVAYSSVNYKDALAARPIEAMVPPGIIVLAIQASTSPPRLSTAPAQLALSSGLIFERSRLFLDMTSPAPRSLR